MRMMLRSGFLLLLALMALAASWFGCSSGRGPIESSRHSWQQIVTPSGAITATADDLRTGWYPNQPNLSPGVVAGSTFGRRWRTALTLTCGEQVFAQPLVSNGTVFVVTEANNVYALDASTGAIKASRALGAPWHPSDIGCGDLVPNLGVTGAPVIDSASNTAYFLSKTYVGSATAWFAHAVDVDTLVERPNFPVQIQGTAA